MTIEESEMEVEYVTLWQRGDLFVEAVDSRLRVWRGGREWASSDKLELTWDECAWLIGRINEAGVVEPTDG